MIGIDSDLLFPPSEQKLIANWIPNAEYVELNSPYGHDAFLIEFDWLRNTLQKFIRETRKITITTTFKRHFASSDNRYIAKYRGLDLLTYSLSLINSFCI